MLDRMLSAGFQDIIETYEIALDIYVRVIDAVSDAGLCCQIDHYLKLILFKQSIDRRLIRDITADKSVPHGGRPGGILDQREAILLQGGIVVIIHIVKRNNGTSIQLPQESDNEIRTDETGTSGNQYCFSVQADLLFHHSFLSDAFLLASTSCLVWGSSRPGSHAHLLGNTCHNKFLLCVDRDDVKKDCLKKRYITHFYKAFDKIIDCLHDIVPFLLSPTSILFIG